MTQSNNNSNSMWFIVMIFAVLAAVMNMLGVSSNSNSAPTVNRNTFEHRYATERLKQEGYSETESQRAADAIVKFHEAQKNRYK